MKISVKNKFKNCPCDMLGNQYYQPGMAIEGNKLTS
jgi:hypothetical protein